MPRSIVITAEADILRDEGESYAQRTFLAGVDTEGYCYDGMIHGFLRMAGVVERSNQALDRDRRVAHAVSRQDLAGRLQRDARSQGHHGRDRAEAGDPGRDARLALLGVAALRGRAALRLRRLRLRHHPLLAAALLTVRRLRHPALVGDGVEVGAALGCRKRGERLLGSLRIRVRRRRAGAFASRSRARGSAARSRPGSPSGTACEATGPSRARG